MAMRDDQDHDEDLDGGGGIAAIISTLLFGLAGFVLALPAFLTALVTYLAFLKGRVAPSVIGSLAASYALFLLVTGLWRSAVETYIAAFPALLERLVGSEGDPVILLAAWSRFVLAQLPLLIGVGLLIGAAVVAIRYLRRQAWEEFNFRLTPREWLLKRLSVRALRKGEGRIATGAVLGISPRGKKLYQLDKEAASHTFVAGASGSGKTTTMMTQARDHIRRGHGLAFLDLKGAADVPEILHQYAKQYGRDFYHFQITDDRYGYTGTDIAAYYDPIARGDASRRKDLIIGGRQWSEDYYKGIVEDYLQTAFGVAIHVPNPENDSLTDVIQLLDPKELNSRLKALTSDDPRVAELKDYARDWNVKWDRGQESAINGLRTDLKKLRGSSAGRYLRKPPSAEAASAKVINLFDAAQEGAVVVFSLDSSNYGETSKLVANYVVQDLKTVSSELRRNPAPAPFHIYIDEFSAMGSDNVIQLVNKARDANMPVSLSTQALGDLTKVDASFADQLIGIINCFIIHRANQEEDVEMYAGLTGKTKKWKINQSVARQHGFFGKLMGFGRRTGSGSVEQVEEHRIPAHEIQDLPQGHAIYIAKSPKQRVERVEVIPPDLPEPVEEADEPPAAGPDPTEVATAPAVAEQEARKKVEAVVAEPQVQEGNQDVWGSEGEWEEELEPVPTQPALRAPVAAVPAPRSTPSARKPAGAKSSPTADSGENRHVPTSPKPSGSRHAGGAPVVQRDKESGSATKVVVPQGTDDVDDDIF